MRSIFVMLPLVILAACTPPPLPLQPEQTRPQSSVQTNATRPAGNSMIAPMSAIFKVPMDPGTIPCAALNNPMALNAAIEWTTGQARAAALTGRMSDAVDTTSVANNLTAYCKANTGHTIRTAATQLGF